jgi:DNA-binding XRE family transcriptional regulator
MHHLNYLPSFRRRYALSEQELANLVGYASKSTVCRFERGLRPPTFRFALACEVVFGERARDLFPAHYARLEEMVLARALKLDEKVRHRTGAAAAKKRELLEGMVERASKSDPS